MQPQQPQGPQSAPQGGMNFDQNPFEEMMQQKMAGAQQAPQSPMPQAGGDQSMMPEALQPGKTGDGAKFLMGAIQQLHGYLGYSTEPQEIEMLRNLINIITQLLSRDQEKASATMKQGAPTGNTEPTASVLPAQ